ncbi:MAG: hypothetical protein COA88_02960 [Kordia sp.]|nr:MAG: hypothetical protein COA88_02960 [Kordia sp.]
MKEYYETRYISKTNDKSNRSFFFDSDNRILLKDEILVKDKIVLLGNPGMGKTTELNNLFESLWQVKDDTGLIPFHIDLKYFRKTNKFEDLIKYNDWKELPSILFILDGLDEIESLQDFISEFEIFTSTHSDLKIKYVVSCRTNIYEKHLITISGFETYFLDSLGFHQAKSVLYEKYSINIDNLTIDENNLEFIQSPFFLKLFVDYYNETNELPNSNAEIWDLYINKTIDVQKLKYSKKGLLIKPLLIKRLKTVAMVNELRQRNYISETDLFDIFNSEYEEFTESAPFLVYNSSLENWSFEHRQIQEFFVAKTLQNKPFNEILYIIKIDGTEAIHPSLFNSISFLINIIDKKNPTYDKLISWLTTNQIEIVFKADNDRIDDELRADVFQKYFKRECIKKTLWISTKRTLSVKEIGTFADSTLNFDYLLVIISKYKIYHNRVLHSAIDLLNFFSINSFSKVQFKEVFTKTLVDKSFPISAKSQVIRLLNKHNFFRDDSNYLNLIFEIFENESDKQLNNSLLSILVELEDVDLFYDYILEEFKRANDLVEREVKDEVHRGNKYLVNKLVLKFNNKDNFLSIIKYYFNEELSIYYDNELVIKIVDRCKYFAMHDKNFINNLLSTIKIDYRFHLHETFLKKIIYTSNKKDEALFYLTKNLELNNISFFISNLVTETNLDSFSEIITSKKPSNQEIEILRNGIGSSTTRELSVRFNDKMIKDGVIFKEKVFTSEDVVIQKIKYKQHIQDNFDILFEKDRLIKEIECLIKNYGTEINRTQMRSFRHEWYNKNGHGNILDTSISLLDGLFFSKNKDVIRFEEINELLKNDLIIYKNIKSQIEQSKSRNTDFNTSKEQVSVIKKWCFDQTIFIDFDKIAKSSGEGSFYHLIGYKKLELIFYFQRTFLFELPQEFLLNSIEFFELNKSGEVDDYFKNLKVQVKNDSLFNNKIIYNLLNKRLLGLSLSKHVYYALSHQLEETYPTIRKYFIEESTYIESKKLEEYIKLSQDYSLLKSLCIDDNSYNYWISIKTMLIFGKYKDFCKQKAFEYLKNVNGKHNTDALAILFNLNDHRAFDYLLENLRIDNFISINLVGFSNYNNVKDLKILVEFYHLAYSDKIDRFDSNYYRTFFENLISNLSDSEEGFNKIVRILKKIKSDLKEINSDLFYINLLIDNSKNSYVNSKSVPYSLVDAKIKTNKVLCSI